MTTPIPLITVTLGANPELAPTIAAGLHSGAYELVGGVVRDVKSKQVIAWLRQIGDNAPAALSANLGPLAFQTLVASTSLLTLGVAVVGFALMMKRLDTIKKELDTIKQSLERIERKVDLTVASKLGTALDLARRAFEMHDPGNRREHAHQAIEKFSDAEHYYRGLLEDEYIQGARLWS